MKQNILLLLGFLLTVSNITAQTGSVGIGTANPDSSAALHISATDKGLLIPRMDSTARKNILNPASGLLVFDQTTNSFWYYSSGSWINLEPVTGVFENNSGVVRNSGASSDDFIFGYGELPTNGTSITEEMLFFDEDKGAFRAGRLQNSASWATDSLGNQSVAMGYNVKATGLNSIALGNQAEATADHAIAMGNSPNATADGAIAIGFFTEAEAPNATAIGSNTRALGTNSFAVGFSSKAQGNEAFASGNITEANGLNSTAMGYRSEANGDFSTATGWQTKANGNYSFAQGIGTRSQAYASTVLGRYNVGSGTMETWENDEAIFEIGIGVNSQNRENAVTVLKNGTVSFKDYTFPNGDGSANQVMQTNGNGVLGWVDNSAGAFMNSGGVVRNAGADTDDFVFGDDALPGETNTTARLFFFDEGRAAFRAGSLVNSTEWSPDSLGTYSVAFGQETLAKGYGSLASGVGSRAAGGFSVAMGNQTQASGSYSIAVGSNTKASGNYATAFGNQSTATGSSSSAFGFQTSAIGTYTTAFGRGTTAEAYASFAAGRYNVGGGSAGGWIATQPLFELGNGTSDSTRSNAMTVYKNGSAEFADSVHTGGNLNVGTGLGARIYLGNTMMQSGGPTILRLASSLRPYDDNVHALGSTGRRWTAVWAVNGTIQTSDRRLKKNIEPLAYGLEEILQLNAVDYHWNNEENAEQKHPGLIAQELLEIIPEVVSVPDEGSDPLGVKYAELVPVLINAIQEQQALMVSQNQRIEKLEAHLNHTEVVSQNK